MRNYWLKIFLGAFAIFAVGMVGITVAREGATRVRAAVEGSAPLSIPLAFIPFRLDGERLGTLDRLILYRDAPDRVSAVELGVKLNSDVSAARLEDCRVAANFDWDPDPDRRDTRARTGRAERPVFACLPPDSTPPDHVEYGHVTFAPGDLRLPLVLHQSVVDDLQSGDFDIGPPEDAPPDSAGG